LTGSCLWFDEIFSVHAARHGWNELFSFVAADLIHPPLFYALLKIWIGIGGESLLWLRLFPVLTSVATIVPFALLTRELKLRLNNATLALLLLAVNGYLIKYAQEVRMYSLLLFLSTCSLWLFTKFARRARTTLAQLLALSAVNLLLVYSHYSGWLVVGFQCLWLLVWERRKLSRFVLMMSLLVLAYLPWLFVIVSTAQTSEAGKGLGQNIGWVTRPAFADLAQYFIVLNRPLLFRQSTADTPYDRFSAVLATMLIGVPLIVFLWHAVRTKKATGDKRRPLIYGSILFFCGPCLILFILSWILPYSIWGTRHLIAASVPYSILVALALQRLRPIWLKMFVSILLGAWIFLNSTVLLIVRSQPFIWCAWDQLAQQAAQLEPSSAQIPLYAFEDLVAYHLWFSLGKPPDSKFRVTLIPNLQGVANDPAYFLPRRFNDVTTEAQPQFVSDHIWIAFRKSKGEETSAPLTLVKQLGYQEEKVLSVDAQGQQAFLIKLRRLSDNR
jgi:uncharacterized membrane protein